MIKAIITDFDGTLVDTFEANYKAYQMAFMEVNIELTVERYKQCFGYRYDRFMYEMGIADKKISEAIKESKKKYYPCYFEFLKPNHALLSLIQTFKLNGGKTAIASTARKENLINAVNFLGIYDYFDIILTGKDVINGKPDPEIYFNAMSTLQVSPDETLIFEDSQVGITAAKASGAKCMIVSKEQFKL